MKLEKKTRGKKLEKQREKDLPPLHLISRQLSEQIKSRHKEHCPTRKLVC